jgi:hypothetical protein
MILNDMMEIIFKIWYMVAILPFLVFLEADAMFAEFLKERRIYAHWDIWHSFLVVFIALFIFLWLNGFRL